MSVSSTFRIEPLNKDNYDTWKLQMRAILTKSDAWDIVIGTRVKPERIEKNENNAAAIAAWTKADANALADIILAISPSEIKQIKSCETSHSIWIKLQSVFQSSGPAKKAQLLKRLTQHKMAEGDDTREHLNNFFDTVDKLSDMNVDIHPELLSTMLLNSLSVQFEYFCCAMESRDELPTPEVLRVKILEASDSRKSNAREMTPNAMFINKYGSGHDRNKKNVKSENETRGNSSRREVPKFYCYKCKKPGHKASECRSKQKHQSAKKVENISFNAFAVSGSKNLCQQWCLDSGATSHLCNKVEKFSNLNDRECGVLNLANDSATTTAGMGTVNLTIDVQGDKKNISLGDTLHVPDLRSNLLSVGKITDHGHEVIFKKNCAIVFDQLGDTKMIAEKHNGLYYVREQSQEASIAKNNKTYFSFEAWHRRMGHVNVRDLICAGREGRILGISCKMPVEEFKCEICFKNKITRNSFPKQSNRVTSVLDIIHSDVCGPMRVNSIGGARYYVEFIDDNTRWCEVRFLKNKSEVLGVFREFVALVENQKGTSVKTLQSDNGTEYTNNEFDKFLKYKGIARRLTTPYTPQQNGVAERKNRTLVDMARCLLSDANLPSSFWAEAINTANFIRNRCPTKSLNGISPYEAWTGKVPDVSGFKIFGSKVFYHEKDPSKGKFEPRGKEGLFMGYSEESKAFRVWSTEHHKIIITRDVRFIEQFGSYLRDPGKKIEKIIPEDDFLDEYVSDRVDIEFQSLENQEESSEKTNCQEKQSSDSLGKNVRVSEDGNEDNITDVGALDTSRRGPGRPRTIRSGNRGRPKKLFASVSGEAQFIEEHEVYLSEIPMKQAMSSPNAEEWTKAIAAELKSTIRNDTWTLVDRPADYHVIGCRVVLRNKFKADGSLERRKARLVAQGFSQKPGVHFKDTFAPVARTSSLRIVAALAAKFDMKIKHFDVTTAYLNGILKEEILMETPRGLSEFLRIIIDEEGQSDLGVKALEMLQALQVGDKVCLLHKSLYGLKQAGKCWNTRLDNSLRAVGAIPTCSDPCFYRLGDGRNFALIVVHVDDIVIACSDENCISKLINHLSSDFKIKDLGNIKFCLGVEFNVNNHGVTMLQKGYINEILHQFGMSDAKSVSTPIDANLKLSKCINPTDEERNLPYRELVGALTYLSTVTRPDISFAVSFLGQFNNCFGAEHWKTAKRVLRYLKGTINLGLFYKRDSESIVGYTDSDWGSNSEDHSLGSFFL